MDVWIIIYVFIIYLVAIDPVLIFLIFRSFTLFQKIVFIIGSELTGFGLILLFISLLGVVAFNVGVTLGLMLFVAGAVCYVLALRGIVK